MKPIIVFDIDDTLTHFESTYLLYATRYDKTLRGTGRLHFDRGVSRSFDWSEEERDEFRKKYRLKTAQTTRVKQNAVKLIKTLSKNYEIYFLSARDDKDFDMDLNGTKKWLVDKCVYFDKVIFNKNKAEEIKKLGNVVAYIDDNIENCESVVNLNQNIKVYLCSTETNLKKKTNLKRIKSFYELEKFLNEDL